MAGSKFKEDNTEQSLIFGYNVENFILQNHIVRVTEEIVKDG